MRESLEVKVNGSTGNVFYTIARTDNLLLSFRLWHEKTDDIAKTIIGWRIRICSDLEEGVVLPDLKKYIKMIAPNLPTTGGSKAHVSYGVGAMYSVSYLNKPMVLKRMEESNLAFSIHDYIRKVLPMFVFDISKGQFKELVTEILESELDLIEPPQGNVISIHKNLLNDVLGG